MAGGGPGTLRPAGDFYLQESLRRAIDQRRRDQSKGTPIMAKQTLGQQKTVGRVMHEFAHGELKSGPGGKGGKVKSRRQAIAIALNEAGASRFESDAENRRSYSRTKRKEARGDTGQQEREGKSHVGASGQRESSRAMGGTNATHKTARGMKAARTRARKGPTKQSLYRRAQKERIEGRSKMTKRQLEIALH
jgi:hypothetical protein